MKCFKYNTWETLALLNILPSNLLQSWLLKDNLWLMPTTKK